MPEIVEIEFLRREVIEQLKGRTIKKVIVNKDSLLNVSREQFSLLVSGKQIVNARRKGKVLIIDLSEEISLVIHFLLTGFMRLTKPCDEDKVQIGFILDDDNCLAINGIMRGGFVKVLKSSKVFDDPALKKLGIDAMSPEFTKEELKKILLKNGKKKIKQILMDQSLIAGIGNAYSDEILFRAGILPMRKASTLTESEINKLFSAFSEVFADSEKYGGASELTFVHLDGKKGEAHKHFLVHKRAGEKCVNCNSIVEVTKINGRSAYFCPKCQK
jgi:formamidopyrimidine-DNA glycosylase